MSLKKHDVIVACEQCRFRSSNSGGSFDVTVPLKDARSGIKGIARLQCTVSSDRHDLELREWLDDEQQSITPSANIEKRVLLLLDDAADHRICGNRHLCPPEVVRAVEKQNRS